MFNPQDQDLVLGPFTNLIRSSKKDLKGLRKNARYYTKEEDLDILKYIKDNDMFAPL